MPGLPSCLFPSGFAINTLYTLLLYPTRATCPAHLILLDFITRTILGEQYRSFLQGGANKNTITNENVSEPFHH